MGLGSMRRNAIPSTILTKQNDDVIGPRKGEVAGRRLSLLDCHNSAIRSAPICRKDTEVLEGSASYFPSLKPDPIANRGDTARYSPMELGMVRMEVDLRGRRQERVHTRPNLRSMGTFKRANDGRDLLHTQTRTHYHCRQQFRIQATASNLKASQASHPVNVTRTGDSLFEFSEEGPAYLPTLGYRKPGTAKARGRERMTQEG